MNQGRPSLVIYGNCQAEFLGLLLSRTPSIASQWNVIVASNNLDADAAANSLESHAASTALFWEQHDQRPEIAVREAVRRRLPGGCPVIRFPAVSMETFWPFFFRDPRNVPEPGFPFGRYPNGDRVGAAIAELGLPADRAYERYLELSHEKMPDLEALVERDRSVQRRRDAACDVAMSDAVFANVRSVYQFWARRHLTAGVMATLIERLLDASSNVLGSPSPQMLSELQAAYEAFPGQGEFQQPIHPLVIERLGLTFVNVHTKYRWFGGAWTFEEFVKRYIAFDRSW